ncbi:hypothetical protein HY497_01305 [Candidatus Woesearchaeota archaeon]|nr:hypothetical protein [Candidatus Woesearchaeota archaeon]
MAKRKQRCPKIKYGTIEELVKGLGSVEAQAVYLSDLYSGVHLHIPPISDAYANRLVDACASKGRYDLAARLAKEVAASPTFLSTERAFRYAFMSVKLFAKARDSEGVIEALQFLAEMFSEKYADHSNGSKLPSYPDISPVDRNIAKMSMGYAEMAGSLKSAREFAAIAGMKQRVSMYDSLLEIQLGSKK